MSKGCRLPKERNTKTPQCSDQCEHCIYIEEGDFMCDVAQDVTIVDWKPFPCACPKKRQLTK